MVHTRFFECAKQVFEYQNDLVAERTATSPFISGYSLAQDGAYIATLSAWYGLIKEKRQWRQDFVKALTRSFGVDLTTEVAFVSTLLCPVSVYMLDL